MDGVISQSLSITGAVVATTIATSGKFKVHDDERRRCFDRTLAFVQLARMSYPAAHSRIAGAHSRRGFAFVKSINFRFRAGVGALDHSLGY